MTDQSDQEMIDECKEETKELLLEPVEQWLERQLLNGSATRDRYKDTHSPVERQRLEALSAELQNELLDCLASKRYAKGEALIRVFMTETTQLSQAAFGRPNVTTLESDSLGQVISALLGNFHFLRKQDV